MKENDLLTANITLSRTQWALLDVVLDRQTGMSPIYSYPVFSEIRDKIESKLDFLYEEEIKKTGFEEVSIKETN